VTRWIAWLFVAGLVAFVFTGAWESAPRWLRLPLALLALLAILVVLVGPAIALIFGHYPFGSLYCDFMGGPSCPR
jgi:hypothetical protein